MIPPAPHAFWRGPSLLLLAVVLLFVGGVSLSFIQGEIAPFYPLYMDQNGYLSAAYAYADTAQKDGTLAALQAHLGHDSARLGFVPSLNSNMSLLASGLFLFLGESRVAALSIHVGSWILLLATVFFVVGKISHRPAYAFIACGFLLFLKMPLVAAGGMADFRMDFPAACWMGISIALWTLFLHQPKAKTAWFATFATMLLLFFRIIALAYLALPMAVLGLLLVDSFWRKRRRGLRRAIPPLLVLGAWAVTLILWDWAFLRSYYFDTQLGSELAVRGADKTWNHTGDALLYYPRSLAQNHFGWKPFYILTLAAVFSALIFFFKKKGTARTFRLPVRWSSILFCLCAAAFPLAILTANPHRTPQVAGISAIALALAGFLIFLAFSPRQGGKRLGMAGVIVLLAGAAFWPWALFASAPFKNEARQEALGLNQVFETVFKELTRDPNQTGTYAVLDFSEALIGYGVWFYGREHLHSNRKVNCVFPLQVQKIDADPLLITLKGARIVILPRDPDILKHRPYPISQSMFEHYPLVKAEVSRHMALQSSFTYQGVLYDIFASQ